MFGCLDVWVLTPASSTANDQFMTQLTQAYEDYAVEAEQSQATRALDDLLLYAHL